MAELPEIKKICGQMDDCLKGKAFLSIEILQEKCANATETVFNDRLSGKRITGVSNKGKWIHISLWNQENLLISLGMGADILYFDDESDIKGKYQIKVNFEDGSGFTIRYWWFGSFFIADNDELQHLPEVKDLAIDAFDPGFTIEYLQQRLKGKKQRIKNFLMNQRNVSGIGNMYMHDILFLARLHPNASCAALSEEDITRLYNAILDVFNLSVSKGASDYEYDFFGQKGSYGMGDFYIGYKKEKPCPECGQSIEFIKTGSTGSYICPKCQVLK